MWHLKILKYLSVVVLIIFFSIFFLRTYKERAVRLLNVNKLNHMSETSQELQLINQNTDQLLRRERVAGVCSKMPEQQLKLPPHRHILISHHYKLLYCWIHKVASTSWISIFSNLANRSVQKYYREIKVLAIKSDKELRNVSKNSDYVKFLIVRNPFDRLVSAYRDRIEDNSRFTAQAWLYAPKMLSQRKLVRKKIFNHTNSNKLIIIPTFIEFITLVINTSPASYDVHWRRYYDHCMPCSMNYDMILKLETFNNTDQHFLIDVMGLNDVGIHFKHLQQTAGGMTTYQVTCEYLKNLTSQEVTALYSIYELDFTMFGYSLDTYSNCTKNFNI